MFIATLLTAPTAPVLDAALVESLRNAWGGGDAIWLAPDEAAEFAMPSMPDNQAQVWENLQDLGVDLVVQPHNARRKRILLADMDSTMIQQECIDELAAEAGVGEKVAQITARAMNGELDFEATIIETRGAAERPKNVRNRDCFGQSHNIDARRLLFWPRCGQMGPMPPLVSGGFTPFTAAIAKILGFDEHQANTLITHDSALTGEVGRPILGRDAKVEALQNICSKLGLGAQDVLAVGDGANDLRMLHAAGTGVALHAKPAVAAQCAIRINHGDLTALLYIQGYAKQDFAAIRS